MTRDEMIKTFKKDLADDYAAQIEGEVKSRRALLFTREEGRIAIELMESFIAHLRAWKP